jgi:hypothetical protein
MDGRMRIENPWIEIQPEGPFIPEIDREAIKYYNDQTKGSVKGIDTSLIPEPFIGNHRSPKVVLLSLNPGLAEGDAKAHARPDFRAAMLRNLRHESLEYPFYPLNPQFERTPCAAWWLKKTRRLIEECGREKVAEGLFVIEWFPYHSKKSGLPKKPKKFVCESQRYSCQLAKEMVGKGALTVLLRSKHHWAMCDEGLSKLPFPRSRQNPAITPDNFGEDIFKKMCGALKA